MARRRDLDWSGSTGPSLAQLRYQVLLIPEAALLLALLLIGWVYAFPPAVGALVALTIAVFVTRLLLMTLAAQHLDQAHYQEADLFARTALRLYPWSVDTLTLCAHGLLARGDDLTAETFLRRAARLAPESAVVRSALAGALLGRGEYAAGRAHAIHAERLVAGSPHAAQHLAWLHLHIDQDPLRAQHTLSAINTEELPADLATPLLVLLAEA